MTPRHLFELADLGESLESVLKTAEYFRDHRGSHAQPLTGKSIALVFEKASTRTRLSLEVAAAELGAHPVVLSKQGSQLGRGEPLADTARVLSRMVHAITFRTSTDARFKELSKASSVPVLNALTDGGHPMQILADLITARAEFGSLSDVGFAWIGDGNNMANSWIEAAGLLKLTLKVACPAGYEPDSQRVEQARALGADVQVTRAPSDAVEGAHVVSTDVFTSMGQEAETNERLKAFEGFRVTQQLLAAAAPNAIALHCLPAHRGEEIDDDVIEGPRSRVWTQAEARLHTAKAALCWALETLPG